MMILSMYPESVDKSAKPNNMTRKRFTLKELFYLKINVEKFVVTNQKIYAKMFFGDFQISFEKEIKNLANGQR